MFDDDASNAVIDWLEQLSAKEGYDEAMQLRRDILDADADITWETLSEDGLEAALTAWLGRNRYGGVTLPALPEGAQAAAAAHVKAALMAHQTKGNQPGTLAVEQFGDAIQALWTALRGPDEPDPEGKPNGAAPRMDLSLKGGR